MTQSASRSTWALQRNYMTSAPLVPLLFQLKKTDNYFLESEDYLVDDDDDFDQEDKDKDDI